MRRIPFLQTALLPALAMVWTGAVLADPSIGRVNAAGYNRLSMCSGTLIAPDRVLTAAHCVADPDTGALGRVTDMVFVAGWDGAAHDGAARVAEVSLHPEAFSGGRLDLRHDMAVLHLTDALDLPFRRLAPSKGTRPQGPYTLNGYARSRPHRLAVTPYCYGETGALWRLRCGAEQGQSGGPVLEGEQVAAVLVAVTEGDALAAPVDDWVRDQARRDMD